MCCARAWRDDHASEREGGICSVGVVGGEGVERTSVVEEESEQAKYSRSDVSFEEERVGLVV